MQRQLGLHLSGAKPALLELAEMGVTVDFFGDDASKGAGEFSKFTNHNRRHNACLNGWRDAISAVATTQTVLGDKKFGARTTAATVPPTEGLYGTAATVPPRLYGWT